VWRFIIHLVQASKTLNPTQENANNHSREAEVIAVKESEFRFVLARTEKNTNRPYFDDLSHHSLAIASSQLHTGDPTSVMAGLLHDFFKGLLFFKNGNWNHIPEEDHYLQILPQRFNNIKKETLIELMYHHQKRYPSGKDHERIWKQNSIKFAETGDGNNGGIVGSLESRLFISQSIYGLKTLRILPEGRYHWLVISSLHEEMKKYLSELYSQKFKSLLGISSIQFKYIPVQFQNSYGKLSDLLDSLELKDYRVRVSDDCLIIPMPVKNLCKEFTITYNSQRNISFSDNAMSIPFGEALVLFAFDGNEVILSYVDPGRKVDISTPLERTLHMSKKVDQFPYSLNEFENSLDRTFKAQEECSICGAPAREIIPQIAKRIRFTDTGLLLDDRGLACPICYAGYLLEQENISFVKPQEAEVFDVEYDRIYEGILTKDFALSTAGLMWLQVLSAIWYRYFVESKKPEFVLNPTVILHPMVVRFAPRAFFPMTYRVRKKKYCLQSTITSDLSLRGSEKSMTVDEFKELSTAYKANERRIDKKMMLKKIRSIYGIRNWS
jgi:hypothetical protein